MPRNPPPQPPNDASEPRAEGAGPRDSANDRLTGMADLSLEVSPAFRDVFLLHAPPRAAAALREVGRLMYLSLLEPDLSEPGTRFFVSDQLRALAADLRFAGGMLSSLSAIRLQSGDPAEDKRLCRKAASWARQVSELVQGMEATLGTVEEAR